MMRRFAQLADHAALRSQKASQPTTLDSFALAVVHSLAIEHDMGLSAAERF